LRLLLFSHSSQVAGSEQALLELVRGLVTDHEVACTVVVPGEGPLVDPLRATPADVWIWPTDWWCSSRSLAPEEARHRLARSASTVLTGLPAARRLDPDVVLSITTVAPWGGLTAAILGKPHVWYVTDFGPESQYALDYFLPPEDIHEALRQGADRLLVVSEAVHDRLFPDVEPAPRVLYPRVQVPAVDGEGARPPGDATRITVFANVRPSKGQWDATTALAELSQRGLDTELYLVGHAGLEADDLREHARALAVDDRLRIVGFVPDQHPWMAATDVVLVPSHEETFSLVCLEALLHGKPLVATRVGGIVEFVENGVNALTVPPHDPRALASALETLIRDPDLARRLAETGRAEARRRFTAEAYTGRMLVALDEVAARGRRCRTPASLLAPLVALADERGALATEAQVRADELRAERERVGVLAARLGREEERALALETGAEAERKRAETLEAELRAALERVCELDATLRQEREHTRRLGEELGQLTASLQRVSETRAWRLVHAYWRVAGRLRNRP
jgi:hypothetical protein